MKGAKGELRFSLTEQPDTLGFGISSYTVKQELGESGSWKITAPDNVPVLVNGIELDESYRADEAVWPAQFNTLHDTSLAPRLAVYRVDGLYVKPEVTVSGAEVQVDYSEKRLHRADLPYQGRCSTGSQRRYFTSRQNLRTFRLRRRYTYKCRTAFVYRYGIL